MPELSYCAQQTRRHDKDRFLCALFAPPERREALFALYALDLELARIPERVTEPLLGQMRYQWWNDTLKEAAEGREPLGHQVVTPMAEAIRSRHLEAAALERLVETRMRDLEDRPITDLAEFDDYINGTAGVLAGLALDVLDVREAAYREAASHIARAWAIVRLIRNIPFHAVRGRVFLPLSELGPDVQDVLAGRPNKALTATVERLTDHAAKHLVAADGIPGLLSSPAEPIVLQGVAARSEIRRLERCGYNAFHTGMARPAAVLPLRLWLAHAWRRKG